MVRVVILSYCVIIGSILVFTWLEKNHMYVSFCLCFW